MYFVIGVPPLLTGAVQDTDILAVVNVATTFVGAPKALAPTTIELISLLFLYYGEDTQVLGNVLKDPAQTIRTAPFAPE